MKMPRRAMTAPVRIIHCVDQVSDEFEMMKSESKYLGAIDVAENTSDYGAAEHAEDVERAQPGNIGE
jgi:hypothetical protein